MFANKPLRRNAIFGTAEWSGGMYGSTCIAGSRPGNIIAGTWAAVMRIGKEG
jgi:sphinganine-1-phosphate aldolase